MPREANTRRKAEKRAEKLAIEARAALTNARFYMVGQKFIDGTLRFQDDDKAMYHAVRAYDLARNHLDTMEVITGKQYF